MALLWGFYWATKWATACSTAGKCLTALATSTMVCSLAPRGTIKRCVNERGGVTFRLECKRNHEPGCRRAERRRHP